MKAPAKKMIASKADVKAAGKVAGKAPKNPLGGKPMPKSKGGC